MWRRFEEGKGRGRPTRRSIYGDLLKSITLIAEHHGVDSKLLIEAFVEAWSNETSHLESLKITCRAVNQDSAIFLITLGEKAVSQFPISLEVLKNPEYFKAQIQEIPPYHKALRYLAQTQQKIGDLRHGMKGIDVKGKIADIPPRMRVHTKFGTIADVSNVTVEDETGSIRLGLWNEQIDQVQVGDEVELENCRVIRYRGDLQLRLRRKSTFSVIQRGESG